MIIYRCDMCGEMHDKIDEMANVDISHERKLLLGYPRGGKFHVCEDCENKLLKTLLGNDDNGWISVKERLPEFNQKCFCVYNDVDDAGVPIRRQIIAELGVDGYWMEGCIWHPDTSVTHWRPLPNMPV